MREKNTLLEKYYEDLFGSEPSAFVLARQKAFAFSKLGISLARGEASLLSFLIEMNHCKKFVEIGTLTGYSALWILRALPADGELWTLEKDPEHAQAAQSVLQSDARAKILVGDAKQQLETLSQQGPFDGVFIDGNKSAYYDYLIWSEKNLKSGGLIIADNVFLGGSVYSDSQSHFSVKQIEVMKKFNQRLADPQLYKSLLIPTEEGLFVAIKN